MAICKMCHKTIPDGMDFCEECEKKRSNQADESYLDSLLSSVTADLTSYSEQSFENVSKHIAPKMKDDAASADSVPVEAVSDAAEDIPPIEVPAEIQEDIPADIIEETPTDITDEIPADITDEIPADITDEIPADITDEIPADITEEIPADITDEIPADITDEIPADINDEPAIEINDEIAIDIPEETADSSAEDIPTDDIPAEDIPAEDIPAEDIPAEDIPAEDTPAEDSSDVDELLDSLLADMDAAGGPEPEPEKIDPDDLTDIFAAAEEEHSEAMGEDTSESSGEDTSESPEESTDEAAKESDKEIAEEEPIIELSDEMIEQINDGQDISAGESTAEDTSEEGEGLPGIDEIDFSADAVDSTKLNIDEISIETPSDGSPVVPMTPAPDSQAFLGEAELENSDSNDSDDNLIEPIGDFDVDSLLNDLDDGTIDKKLVNLDADKKKAKKKPEEKPKKNWFQRLFGNIEEDPKEIAKREAKEKAEREKKELHEANQKKRKEASKEEKEAQKAEKAALKEEEAKKKAELKRQKQEEAKEKARKKKEERLALEEFEVNEGKINRAGATILFVIFAILTVFIIVGTNIYSYNLSIKRAEDEFEIKHYNDAYYEVYGLKIQDEDIELYDKIMTVMYVNTQLNAYEYYMTSNNRDKALDSLLKGLQRYDKYLDLAELLGIKDDLNYVKDNILEELSSEFNIDEYEAKAMVETRDEIDYSEYIYALLGTYEGVKIE